MKIIKIEDYPAQTSYACPTIFEFDDVEKNHYYFRVRHGCWRLQNETTDETIASGDATVLDIDGCCTWDEARMLCASEKVFIMD